jgi:hypothetical protein
MTTSYLLANKEPISKDKIELNKEYRVIGMHVSGAIYTPIKIEDYIIYFKGYAHGSDLNKVKLYLVD